MKNRYFKNVKIKTQDDSLGFFYACNIGLLWLSGLSLYGSEMRSLTNASSYENAAAVDGIFAAVLLLLLYQIVNGQIAGLKNDSNFLEASTNRFESPLK